MRLKRPNEQHGMHKSPEYAIWASMKDRCENFNNQSYTEYGGRGITVCQRWSESFIAFIGDVGKRPNKNLSLDRIDNEGNYEPNNCRWATSKTQMQNTRRNRFVPTDGKSLVLAETARKVGIHKGTLRSRLENERLSTEEALNLPVRKVPKYLFKGKLKTIKEWADEIGISKNTLEKRLRSYKWPIERALIRPVTRNRHI
jgi:predicted DNA-binding protein (UPF0251 family)